MVALAKQQSNTELPINEVIHGDCLVVLKSLPDNSVDAIVCDPPSSIHFMGKSWDSDKGGRTQWVAWLSEIMTEALRCLKPGGYGLIWALPRTSHWTALALEDAGFLVKDVISHHFGSGFPKSMSLDKAIDKHFKAEREVVGTRTNGNHGGGTHTYDDDSFVWPKEFPVTTPATPEAQQHIGKGTALKPSTEFWWLVQKPISEKTIAANVLRWNCGALNIDACRVGLNGMEHHRTPGSGQRGGNGIYGHSNEILNSKQVARAEQGLNPRYDPQGRFPSHLLLSHSIFCTEDSCDCSCPIRILNQQSGIRKSVRSARGGANNNKVYGSSAEPTNYECGYNDQGGASRYFQTFHYFSKSSRRERNAGCEGLPEQEHRDYGNGKGAGRTQIDGEWVNTDNPRLPQVNNHPCVKSQQLMRWLVRLVTPPDGIVLDCFAGSGSTLVACVYEGFHFVGIEQSEEYCAIARCRVQYALSNVGADPQRIPYSPLAPRGNDTNGKGLQDCLIHDSENSDRG